jgi:carbon-monoxide dehydrogenase large subunit
MIGYDDLRKEQADARAQGKLFGIGVASFTEVVGAGPAKDYDIIGVKMNDGAELRIHPTGKAILKISCQTQGQGHETTFAQIVAGELGIQPETSRSCTATRTTRRTDSVRTRRARRPRRAPPRPWSPADPEKAMKLAAHLLEVAEEDIEYRAAVLRQGRARQGEDDPGRGVRRVHELPEDMEAGLEGVYYYNPPNLTFPFGTYVVSVEVDPDTGEWKVRRMVAVDDCGVRINPMIVEGQIHGGLTEGYGIAAMELITFDEDGNCIGSNFMDYLLPTAWETPKFEMGETSHRLRTTRSAPRAWASRPRWAPPPPTSTP